VTPARAPIAGEPRALVLVEGDSDRLALEALAERRGRNLAAERTSIVALGGAANIGRFLDRLGPRGSDVRVAALYDAGAARSFERALERAGRGSALTTAAMEEMGFYMCVADLEDELIRALGTAAVERVIEAEGELGSLRTLQRQAAHRGRSTEEQLRRFMGTRAHRKARYATLLVRALDLTRVPRPLDRVLAHVEDPQPAGSS
jgi:hypothetical protein